MTKPNDEVRGKNEYARNLRLFVQRLIKMAKEQIVAGRNYGWTQDSMAQELDIFIQERLASERKRWVEEMGFYEFISVSKEFLKHYPSDIWTGGSSDRGSAFVVGLRKLIDALDKEQHGK